MIVEIITILTLLAGGSAVVYASGVKGWVVPPLGFISGVSLLLIFGAVQAIAPISSSPILTLVLVALASVVFVFIAVRRGFRPNINIKLSLLALIGVTFLVVIFYCANLVSWDIDSFRYLMSGSLLAENNYDHASINAINKRMLGVPLLHAPAHLAGEWYLRSIHPLISLSSLAVVAWIAWSGLKGFVDRSKLLLFVGLGLSVLVTTNRFVFHSFFVNGHLLVGVFLLIIAGGAWLLASQVKSSVPDKALLVVVSLAIPALVVTRPEASILATLALLPLFLSRHIEYRVKKITLLVLGASTILWQLFVTIQYAQQGGGVPISAWGLLAVGVAMLLGVPILKQKLFVESQGKLLYIAEFSLWAALAFFAIRNPSILIDSVLATVENLSPGGAGWGVSWAMVALLLLFAFVFLKFRRQEFIRFPVTTFIPTMFLLAYLRGVAFRVGDGDSLNRMWIQISLVAILYIIVAASSGVLRPWVRWVSKRGTDKARSVSV